MIVYFKYLAWRVSFSVRNESMFICHICTVLTIHLCQDSIHWRGPWPSTVESFAFYQIRRTTTAGTLLYSPIRTTTSSSTSLITTRRLLVKQDKETRASIVFLGSIAILNGDDSLIRNDSPVASYMDSIRNSIVCCRFVKTCTISKEELRINSLWEHHKVVKNRPSTNCILYFNRCKTWCWRGWHNSRGSNEITHTVLIINLKTFLLNQKYFLNLNLPHSFQPLSYYIL
jgi:hypothetical protein